MSDNVSAETALDRASTLMTRATASYFPRRSFFGKVGRYTVAAAIGIAAPSILWPDAAYATTGCWDGGGASCNGQNSVTCGCLTGVNTCPSDTCQCGCWAACDSSKCPFPASVQFCDCCHQNGVTPHSSCASAACSHKPTNCFRKEHPGGCGSVGQNVIRCRMYSCQNHPTC